MSYPEYFLRYEDGEENGHSKKSIKQLIDFLSEACRNLPIHTLKAIEHNQVDIRYQDLYAWYLSYTLGDFDYHFSPFRGGPGCDEVIKATEELERLKWQNNVKAISCSACQKVAWENQSTDTYYRWYAHEEFRMEKYETFEELHKECLHHLMESQCGGFMQYHFYVREPKFIREKKNKVQQAHYKEWMDRSWNAEKEIYE